MAEQDWDHRPGALAYALSLPESYKEHPWEQTVVKVGKKVFLFFNGAYPEAALNIGVKLPQSGADVLSMPFAEPMGYGLGRHGWVTLCFAVGEAPPEEIVNGWILESYRAIAPKRLLAKLAQG